MRRSILSVFSLIILLTVCAASCRRNRGPVKPSRFDQERAFVRLTELCAIGPRNNGSESKKRSEQWIQQALENSGAEVKLHDFSFAGADGQVRQFRNIIGRINPKETRRVLLGTHYDTRSQADHDSNISKRVQPIIGANDGASGVAVLLELAAFWKNQLPKIGVDLFFFDGEDFGGSADLHDYFLGSKAYSHDYPEYRPEWGVVIDMVGDKDFEIKKDRISVAQAPKVVEKLWATAQQVGSDGFVDLVGGRVFDDHTAFLERGIPVVLLIDFHYQWFHTTEDTPDKCSADSLGQVGRVLLEMVEMS